MNIVFDFGGVLFDWQPARLMRELLPNRARDHAAAERLVRDFFQGYGGDWAAFDRGTTTQEALAQRIGSRLGWPLDEVNAVISAVPAALTPRPAMVALLDALHHRGWPLYFLSNMPASYADHLDRTHDFLGRFRGGVYSSRSGLIKPEPEIYALTSRRFALEGATLFIDDVEVNVEAARRHGWQAIHFRDAVQLERELAARELLAGD